MSLKAENKLKRLLLLLLLLPPSSSLPASYYYHHRYHYYCYYPKMALPQQPIFHSQVWIYFLTLNYNKLPFAAN